MTKKKTKKYIWARGKRKRASATLRLYQGRGKFMVNDRPVEEYFPGVAMAEKYSQPFRAGDCENKFTVEAKVKGSGLVSQAEAVQLALARALTKYNPDVYRPLMRQAGLLTVDARARERRKAGQMGRARKKKQSPKR